MNSTSQIKCSLIVQHLLFIFLVYFNSWNFVGTIEEMNEPNLRHFKDMSQFKNPYSSNRIQSKYFKITPRRIFPLTEMSPVPKVSTSRISRTVGYLFQKKLPSEVNSTYATGNMEPIYVNSYSPKVYIRPSYLQMNKKSTQNENDIYKCAVDGKGIPNVLQSQLNRPFRLENNMHSDHNETVMGRKMKKSAYFTKQKYMSSVSNKNAAAQKFHKNFSGKYKDNKMNSDVDSSVISPGDFYRQYFSKHVKPDQTNITKFRDLPSWLIERQIFKDGTMGNSHNIINNLSNTKITTRASNQRYNVFRKKKSKASLKNDKASNHVEGPVKINYERVSKILNSSDDHLESQKIIRLKKKTVIMEWNNGRIGTTKTPERFSKLFNVYGNTGHGNQEMQQDYRGASNINKENIKSSPGIQTIEDITDELRPFSNQKGNFAHRNNVIYKNVNYGSSPTEVQAGKNFNEVLHSSQDQRTNFKVGNNLKSESMFLIGNNEDPGFMVKYSEKTHTPENYNNDFGVLKGGNTESHKAQKHSNLNIQTNISKDINVVENSDSIISKENGETHKSNQKNQVHLQIFKEVSRHNSAEPGNTELQASSLAQNKQESQTRVSKENFSLILMALIGLTLTILLLSCCAFLITKERKNMEKSTPEFASIKRNLEVADNISPTCINCDLMHSKYDHSEQKDDKYITRKKTLGSPTIISIKYYQKNSEIFETAKHGEQESLKENVINGHVNPQEILKSDVKIDKQDAGIINHSPLSHNLKESDKVCAKCDLQDRTYDTSNLEEGMHFQKLQTLESPKILDAKYYQKDSEICETSKYSEQESLTEDRIENIIGNPWDWILKHVKTRDSFRETHYKMNQNDCVFNRNNLFADENQESIRRNICLKEERTATCPSPKYYHCHFENLRKPEADHVLEQQRNAYSSNEAVHGDSHIINKENYEQNQSPCELNYSLKDKLGSPWHRNLINVKTKSVVSLHRSDAGKNCALYDSEHIDKVNSSSIFKILPAQKGKRITSNIQSFNEIHFNDTDVLSQYRINDRTYVCISPGVNSNSSADQCVVKTEKKISDSFEQSQHYVSTSSDYPNSDES